MNIHELTLDVFSRLMSINTVNPPGNEKPAAGLLQEIFASHGLDSDVQDLGDNRANFICTIGTGRPVLEFCGHLDVVPAEGAWTHPPFAASEEKGRIYGRGSCDMKGGVAAMCAAAISMAPEIISGKGALRLVFVADEEQANAGMHAFQSAYEPADYTVLGEPTSLQVAIAHRGTARFHIDLHGQPYHAALRSDAESAVIRAARTVLALEHLNERLKGIRHAVLPAPSVCVTKLMGYEKDNIVPGTVRLLADYRILPGTSEADAMQSVREALDQEGITDYAINTWFYMPGGELPKDSPFISLCCETVSAYLGSGCAPGAFDASCEQCFLLEKGSNALIIGPGSLKQAHTVDEYIEKDQLLKASGVYSDIIRKVCLQNEKPCQRTRKRIN